MVRRLSVFFLLQLLYATTGVPEKGRQDELQYFSKRCPPERCSGGSPEIRYPFRLESSHPYCGYTGLVLSCSGGRAILPLPSLPPTLSLSVVAINYSVGVLTAKLDGPSCPLKYINLLNFSASSYYMFSSKEFITVICSPRLNHSSTNIAGPISCLGGGADSIYAVDSYSYMDEMPPYCVMVSDSVSLPYNYEDTMQIFNLTSLIDSFTQKMEIKLEWAGGYQDQCTLCESSGGSCGFSQSRNQSVCFKTEHHGSKAKLFIGSSVGGASVIVLVSILIFYINKKKSDYEEEMRLKIENFLATYRNTKPTRYTYSEIKKITMRFKQKLGQGGFGAVYKGWIPSGVPVAVKMIEIANKDGDEFINEVATIGRIHHVNVVRLLGFCSDGTRRALIYEFMPNGSLEKLIFSRETSSFGQQLVLEKLEEIAIGIAQGIEYLHQGCDLRILHFDIKPHNILLDHNLNPKISDFGLAKLCSRDQSMITMTAARGTMGYVAPEIYSRNFGSVSYKSDVYSFGMLLLEMVSGRKNVDPSIEDQSAVYFPEWVYDQLVQGQDLGLVVDRQQDEEEIAEKLVVVALWCIQWNPKDRPTMTRVVQMLVGELQDLEMPPRPFAASSLSEDAIPISSV